MQTLRLHVTLCFKAHACLWEVLVHPLPDCKPAAACHDRTRLSSPFGSDSPGCLAEHAEPVNLLVDRDFTWHTCQHQILGSSTNFCQGGWQHKYVVIAGPCELFSWLCYQSEHGSAEHAMLFYLNRDAHTLHTRSASEK